MTMREKVELVKELEQLRQEGKNNDVLDECISIVRGFRLKYTLKKGDDIWYADAVDNIVEHGLVVSVQYSNSGLDSFGVKFDVGDFEEFYGSAIDDSLFLSKDDAEIAVGIK